ncbi:hypothetical protein HWV62_30781 [Athelia sp. TMB]|nr:hypothetical protein HWV62_30781 [Athelia sp. TMB]
MLQGDGSPPDSPDPFHFPDQVDDHGQLTFQSSSKNNNRKIRGHQLPETPLVNSGIPPFALAASSPEVPWELLAAIWTAYCYTASTQQLPSPNHEAYTRTTHSTRTLPLDVETDQGIKSRRTYLSKSARPGSGSYQAVSEARRKKDSTRGDAMISSDAHLDNAGQGVGPHRNDRRSRTSNNTSICALSDFAFRLFVPLIWAVARSSPLPMLALSHVSKWRFVGSSCAEVVFAAVAVSRFPSSWAACTPVCLERAQLLRQGVHIRMLTLSKV